MNVFAVQDQTKILKVNAVTGSTSVIVSSLDDASGKGFTRGGLSLIKIGNPKVYKIYDLASESFIKTIPLDAAQVNTRVDYWDPDGGRIVTHNSGSTVTVCVTWYNIDTSSCELMPSGYYPSQFRFMENDNDTMIGVLKNNNSVKLLIFKIDNVNHTTDYRVLHLNASNSGDSIVAIDSTPLDSLKVLMGGFNGNQFTRIYNVGTYASTHFSIINNNSTEIQPQDMVSTSSCSLVNLGTTSENDFHVYACASTDQIQMRLSGDSSVWRVETPNMQSALLAESSATYHAGISCAKRIGNSCDIWMAAVPVSGGTALRLIDSSGNTRQLTISGSWQFAGITFNN
jgi:hypothetical protein